MKSIKFFIFTFILVSISHTTTAYQSLQEGSHSILLLRHDKSFTSPDIGRFKHLRNIYLSNLFEPEHRVIDKLGRPGDNVEISAKFEYDCLLRKDLEDEFVRVYLFDSTSNQWEDLGRYITDRDGRISVSIVKNKAGEYPLKAVVEGDGSIAEGLLTLIEEGQKTVVFDIDGTLTTSDFEMFPDVIGVRDAKAYYYAQDLLNLYRSKGYLIVYLTARPEWLTASTKEWLKNTLNQASYHLHTKKRLKEDTANYKYDYLKTIESSIGANILYTYGNAKTDIEAYKKLGLSDEHIYTIGKHAGKENTSPIHGNYHQHYYDIEQMI